AALGDGGAVTTDNAEYEQKLRFLQQYGWKERYISDFSGINSRLDEIQAAILRVKLSHLEKETEMRQKIAGKYRDNLSDIEDITLPTVKENCEHVYHLFVVRVKNREKLMAHLEENEIGIAIHFPFPNHLQPAYKGRVQTDPDGMEESEIAADEVLSLPMYPYLKDEEVDYVVEKIRAFYSA
ncbi:MAG: DegT/DnrJ/EryC1/StrS family aminotransferase, partial [Planctomycetota bacterium]